MKAKGWVVTSAAMIAGIRLWMQVRGKTKTPFAEWAVGFGALMVFLAVMAEWAPQAAGPLAGTIVVGDFLQNGASLFEDLSSIITGGEKGSVLVTSPFGGASSTSSTSSTSSSPAAASPTPAAALGTALSTGAALPDQLTATPNGTVTGTTAGGQAVLPLAEPFGQATTGAAAAARRVETATGTIAATGIEGSLDWLASIF